MKRAEYVICLLNADSEWRYINLHVYVVIQKKPNSRSQRSDEEDDSEEEDSEEEEKTTTNKYNKVRQLLINITK